MDRGNFMTLSMRALRENLGVARIAVATFASQLDFTLNEVEEVKVAVNEAVTNAVVHAYPTAPGVVTVEASIGEGGLEVIVADEGVGIEDIDRAREPSFSSDPERMGMGFAFMEAFMDSLAVQSSPRCGTKVIMHKRPAQAAAGRAVGAAGP